MKQMGSWGRVGASFAGNLLEEKRRGGGAEEMSRVGRGMEGEWISIGRVRMACGWDLPGRGSRFFFFFFSCHVSGAFSGFFLIKKIIIKNHDIAFHPD